MDRIRFHYPSGIQLDIVLLIVFCPLYNAFWRGFGVFQILLAPIILLFIYYKVTERYRHTIKNYEKIFLIMFFQWALLTLMVGKDFFQYSKVLVLASLVFLHPISIKMKSLIYPLLAAVGVVVGYEMIVRQDMVAGVRLSLRVGETLLDPNWIAVFLFAPFCFGLKLIQSNRILFKMIGLLLLSFSAYVVFLTGSRGALLGMIAAMLVWVKVFFSQSRIASIIFVLASFVLCAHVFFSYIAPNADIGLIERYTGGEFGEDRTSIWRRLISEYSSGSLIEIIFGRGPASSLRDVGMSAHNMFLEQLYQTGLFGLVLMVIFLVQLFKDTIKCCNHPGLYIITALFTLSLTTPIWGHIFFMIPLAMVVYVNNAISLENKLEKINQ